MNRQKVVILGGTGFIGMAILRHLSKNPDISLTWSKRADSLHPDNSALPAPFVIEDLETIDMKLLNEADVVIDCVSYGRGRLAEHRNISRRVIAHFRIIDGLINLSSKAHYVLFSSGGAIYGHVDDVRIHEGGRIAPNTEYGLEKALIEMHLTAAAHDGLNASILRVANAYGSGQKAKPGFGVIPTLVNALETGSDFTVIGDGGGRRDYIHVADIVDAVQAVMRQGPIGPVNIATGVGVSIAELIDFVSMVAKKRLRVAYQDAENNEPPYARLDVSKAKDLLGWSPKISWKAGIYDILAKRDLIAKDASALTPTFAPQADSSSV